MRTVEESETNVEEAAPEEKSEATAKTKAKGEKSKRKGFKLRMPSMSPFVRMSLGLVCLTLCMVLVGDMVLGLTSDERRALLDQRKKISETVAVQFSELAEAGDIAGIPWVRYDDPETKTFKLNAERQNGRAAMMGITGCLIHELLGVDALYPTGGMGGAAPPTIF